MPVDFGSNVCVELAASNVKLKANAADLKACSCCNNICIIGLPESIKGPRPTTFFSDLLFWANKPYLNSLNWTVLTGRWLRNRSKVTNQGLSLSSSTTSRPRKKSFARLGGGERIWRVVYHGESWFLRMSGHDRWWLFYGMSMAK